MPMNLYHCTDKECGAVGSYFVERGQAIPPLCRECGQQTLQRVYQGQAPTIRTSDKTRNEGPRFHITMAAMISHGL
jgi:hypothetical protein